VKNINHFRGVLAFDKWVGNADSRQAIFFPTRSRTRLPETGHSLPLGLVAQMVDNGHIFGGSHWRFSDSPLQGLYSRHMVYSPVCGLSSFEPWLDRIVYFPDNLVDRVFKQIRSSWLEDDGDELERMLEKLLRRRKRVPELIEASRSAEANPFPNWRRARATSQGGEVMSSY
jgi:hypothetical protein